MDRTDNSLILQQGRFQFIVGGAGEIPYSKNSLPLGTITKKDGVFKFHGFVQEEDRFHLPG